jgi:hypothetical protein
MSFLYPLFFLGALGIAAPLWLHLRRRQRTNVRLFSALRFLDEEPYPREMPRQIRDWPLFLLRVLAVLLIVAAFAWPIVQQAAAGSGSETRIYVLDNTLSHRVNGAFDRARAAIAREIRRAGPQVQVGVVEIAARSRVVADLSTSHQDAAAAVDALRPSHQRGHYLDGFRLAATLLERSLGEKRTIFVYGDRQRNQWDENLNVPPFLHDVEIVLAEPAGANDAGNLYAANTRVVRFPVTDGSAVSLTLDVGRQKTNLSAVIAIRSNGDEVLRRQLALATEDGTIRTEWKADASAWLRGEGEIQGEPDVLPEDNVTYFAVPPLEPGKVGLLARSPYLRAGLDPEISRGFWDVKVLSPDDIRAAAAADQPKFDSLVVESDYLQSKDARDLLLKHLNNGRGVLLFVTRRTPLVEQFLRTLGFRMAGEKTLPESLRAFRYIAMEHPVLQPFMRPDFGDLLAVNVNKYHTLTSDKAAGLLFAGDGQPVMFETRGTKGRMLIFGFGADATFSNWPLQPDFLPFLDLCLRYARGASEQQTSAEPAEVIFRRFEDAQNASFALVRDKTEVARATASAAGHLRLAVHDEPGIYELRKIVPNGESQLASLVSVSVSAKESQLEYIDGEPAALAAWTAPPAAVPVPHTPARVLLASDPQIWWWWMLIAGAALLIVEMGWLSIRRGTQ